MQFKPPYVFTLAGLLFYFGVLGGSLAIFMTRHDQAIWHGFGGHLSNFSLSILLLFIFGAINMLMTHDWRFIIWAALVLSLANIITETLVPVLNTKDPIDMLFGLAGIAVALGLLCLMRRYSFKPNPQIKQG